MSATNQVRGLTPLIDPADLARSRADLLQIWASKRRERGVRSSKTLDRYSALVARLQMQHGDLEKAVVAIEAPTGPKMRLNTFHSIMAALRHHAASTGDAAFTARLQSVRIVPSRLKKAHETDHRRAKTIPGEDLNLIVAWLQDMPRRYRTPRVVALNGDKYDPRWALRACTFLIATNLVGLRPSEWERARLVTVSDPNPDVGEDHHFIRAVTGKSIRADERYRDIPISNLDDKALLELHLADIKESGVPFDEYLRRCQSRITRANRACFPGRRTTITLYSGRHNFHAGLVQQRFPRATIAYLMGHATSSAEVSGRSYGSGTGGNTLGPANPDYINGIESGLLDPGAVIPGSEDSPFAPSAPAPAPRTGPPPPRRPRPVDGAS